jgi:peptidoglycan/LPS O-acetylase OafA/YrhL
MGVLRFLLALSVAWTHAGLPKGLSGDLCVTIFFVISGFYMSMVLSENGAYTNLRIFYTQRLLRLFPTYWAVLFLSIFAAALVPSIKYGFAAAQEMQLLQQHPGMFASWLVSQFMIVGQDIYFFLGFDENGSIYFKPILFGAGRSMSDLLVIPPAWSLSLELMFYLIAPYIARRSNLLLGTLLLISCAVRIGLAYGADFVDDPWVTRFFPSEFGFFLLGMLGYRLVTSPKSEIASRAGATYLVLSGIAVFSLAANHFGHVNAGLFSKAAFATFFLIAAIPWLFSLSRDNRYDRHVGEYSYPLYLSHVLVFSIWNQLGFSGAWSGYMMIAAAVSTAVLLTAALDKPVNRFRHKLMMRRST